ncbi:DUF4386 domain-containing protein [Saccharothrix variisporea]|uniref:DUF4386 domain-containing protein n=1 Tax=Saccharothrix variisporea TaxID=543527 RepID=A0A495X5A0_9PSEU|nr:DUF4386 domain-containing protein [Saccharothrix variisporea]RKT67793.1 hypothetical protein DFJ66_0969 [Saccharothrix variisporea]
MTSPAARTGPPLGVLAVVFAALFVAGLVLSVVLAGGAVFPSPFGAAEDITAYFRDHQNAVRVGALLQFAASVPLALYAATASARLGVRAPGAHIALAGGLLAAVFLACSALVSWVLSLPEVAGETLLVRPLQDLAFITGGPGHVVPLGLLIAGVAVPGLLTGVLPRGVALAGLVIAGIAELSTLVLLVPQAAYLLPAARFTGLAWLVVTGFLLPRSRRERP